MRRWGWVLIWLLAATLQAQTPQEPPPLALPPDARVANRQDHGVCWWACAETIGRRDGIPQLAGLIDEAVRTGIGLDGADQQAILRASRRRGFKFLTPRGKDHTFLREQLALGRPVIITVDHWRDYRRPHALIVLQLSKQRYAFTDEQGQSQQAQMVTFYNPNHPEQISRASWDDVWHAWTGSAYAFPAARGEPQSQAAPAAGSRPYVYQPRRTPYRVTQTITELPLHVQVVQGEGFPGQYELLDSNQQIKDGIRRPLDVVHDVSPGSHDYYSEFRARIGGVR